MNQNLQKTERNKNNKRGEKLFVSPWDGVRMFYMLKESLIGIQPSLKIDGFSNSWENYLYGLDKKIQVIILS